MTNALKLKVTTAGGLGAMSWARPAVRHHSADDDGLNEFLSEPPMDTPILPVCGSEVVQRNPSALPTPERIELRVSPPRGREPLKPTRQTTPVPQLLQRAVRRHLNKLSMSLPILLLSVAAGLETLYIGFHLLGQYRQPSVIVARSVSPARVPADVVATAMPASAVNVTDPPEQAKRERPVEPARPERRSRETMEAPPVDPPGWATIELPIQVHVFERGRFVGSNDTGRLTLAAGVHELEFVNESLQFRSKQTVRIEPGQAATIQVLLPSGTLSLNALPWSEVVIDGRTLGATPLGRIPLSIGPHEILFRHPQLGEQTRTAVVRAGAETRLTVDLRK